MNFIKRYLIEILIIIAVISLSVLGIAAIYMAKKPHSRNKYIYDKAYAQCIRKAPINNKNVNLAMWVDKCEEIALELSLEEG